MTDPDKNDIIKSQGKEKEENDKIKNTALLMEKELLNFKKLHLQTKNSYGDCKKSPYENFY